MTSSREVVGVIQCVLASSVTHESSLEHLVLTLCPTLELVLHWLSLQTQLIRDILLVNGIIIAVSAQLLIVEDESMCLHLDR